MIETRVADGMISKNHMLCSLQVPSVCPSSHFERLRLRCCVEQQPNTTVRPLQVHHLCAMLS